MTPVLPVNRDLRSVGEVVVIGAGIVGAACAEALARRGADVTLIERYHPTSGASGACEGNIILSDKEPGPELDLGRAARVAYDALAARLPIDCDIERRGSLMVTTESKRAEPIAAYVRQLVHEGVEARLLTGGETRELEPSLSSNVVAGAFFPDGLHVWPMKVVMGLILAAQTLGATLVTNTEVEAIEVERGAVTGVRTSRGCMKCSAVVVAAGVASLSLLGGCGLEMPLRSRKGQIVVTAPYPGLITHNVLDANYMDTVHSDTDSLQVSSVLEMTRRGNMLIGSSRDVNDIDPAARLTVTGRLIERALMLIPALARVLAIRTYAGFRPYLPDARPAIGRTRAVSGLIVATGHEGSGILLGPVTGELVADVYFHRRARVDLAAFDPDRFARAGFSEAS